MEERWTVPCTFTVAEIWLLLAVVKHEIAEINRWRFPPANRELVEELALAALACEDSKIKEYTLMLSEGDCLLIHYNVQPDMKTLEGAVGKQILLKTFRALSELAYGYSVTDEKSDKIIDKGVITDALERSGPDA